jgi:hypothetical protein
MRRESDPPTALALAMLIVLAEAAGVLAWWLL